MMRQKPALIFEQRKDAPGFTDELRQALEPFRRSRHAGELRLQSAGMILRVWVTPMTEGRAGSRHRWTRTSKDDPAPEPKHYGTIDQLIDLLCNENNWGKEDLGL